MEGPSWIRRPAADRGRRRDGGAELTSRRLANDAREYAATLRDQADALRELDRPRIRAWCEWIEEWARQHDPTANPATIIGLEELEPRAPWEHR